MELYIATLIVAEISSGVANPVTTPVSAAAKGASQMCTAVNQSEMLTRYLAGSGGRWGSSTTRQLNHQIASILEQEGTVLNGAGRAPEFRFPGPGGGLKGGTYSDVFGDIGGVRVHVQTQTYGTNGLPIASESAAVSRIRALDPNAWVIQVPK
jgi:filamentous hemagglutinin